MSRRCCLSYATPMLFLQNKSPKYMDHIIQFMQIRYRYHPLTCRIPLIHTWAAASYGSLPHHILFTASKYLIVCRHPFDRLLPPSVRSIAAAAATAAAAKAEEAPPASSKAYNAKHILVIRWHFPYEPASMKRRLCESYN